MDFFNKLLQRRSTAVGEDVVQDDIAVAPDYLLQKQHTSIQRMRNNVLDLQDCFRQYSRAMIGGASAADLISQNAQEFVSGASSHTGITINDGDIQQSLPNMFASANSKMKYIAAELFDRRLENEIISVFEDWCEDGKSIQNEINKLDISRTKRDRSKRDVDHLLMERGDNIGKFSTGQEKNLSKAKFQFARDALIYDGLRKGVEKEISDLVRGRTKALDHCLLRLIEFQLQYHTSALNFLREYVPVIDKYYKDNPKLARRGAHESQHLTGHLAGLQTMMGAFGGAGFGSGSSAGFGGAAAGDGSASDMAMQEAYKQLEEETRRREQLAVDNARLLAIVNNLRHGPGHKKSHSTGEALGANTGGSNQLSADDIAFLDNLEREVGRDDNGINNKTQPPSFLNDIKDKRNKAKTEIIAPIAITITSGTIGFEGSTIPIAPPLPAHLLGNGKTPKPKNIEDTIREKLKEIKLDIPIRRAIVPNEKMTKLHWASIDVAKLHESIWLELLLSLVPGAVNGKEVDLTRILEIPKDKDGYLIEPELIDSEVLQATFKQKVKSAKDDIEDTDNVKTEQKTDKVVGLDLIDAKRSYNISITLARYKVTPEELAQQVLALDDNLNMEELSVLDGILPLAEELDAIATFTGDLELFGPVENWFLEFVRQPQLRQRLKIFLFMQEFPQLSRSLEQGLEIVELAFQEIRHSSSLKHILNVILQMGNILNGGTRTGQAYGFTVESLMKIRSVKSVDNTTTLLHYLVENMEEKYPAIHTELLVSMQNVHLAARVEQAFLTAEVKQMKQNLDYTRRFLKEHPVETSSSRSPSPYTSRPATPSLSPLPSSHVEKSGDAKTLSAPPKVASFFDYAAARHRVIQARIESITNHLKILTGTYFAESTVAWEIFFSIFSTFLTTYSRAQEDINLERMKIEMEESGVRTAKMLKKKRVERKKERDREHEAARKAIEMEASSPSPKKSKSPSKSSSKRNSLADGNHKYLSADEKKMKNQLEQRVLMEQEQGRIALQMSPTIVIDDEPDDNVLNIDVDALPFPLTPSGAARSPSPRTAGTSPLSSLSGAPKMQM